MKEKYNECCFSGENRKKLWNIMRISFLLLMVSCMSVSANAFGQYRVSLDVESVSVMELFLEIQKKTDLFFVFNASDLEDFSEVSVTADNEEVESVLRRVFGNSSLQFTYEGDVIVVKPRDRQQARRVNVSGQVVDGEGKPVTGVAVLITGTSTGVSTDAQGRFSIEFTPSSGSALEFSYIGMEKQTIAYTGQSTLHVVMRESVAEVDEVVVVGYGSVNVKDFTGSVSSVRTEELQDIPFASVDAALAGKASGLSVIKADGAPGGAVRMRLRGGTSLKGTNDPLYIIDGVPVMIENSYIASQSDIANTVEWGNFGEQSMNNVAGGFMRGLNQLSGLNISDIETIDILKDASATAIYGSKAANGVVIITTKRGRRNMRPQLTANYYAGVAVPTKEKLLNARQYVDMVNEAADNLIAEYNTRQADGRGVTAAMTATYNDALAKKDMMDSWDGTDTDWLDRVLRNAFTHSGDISVSGGGEYSSYYTSVSYTSQQGVVKNSDFERISGKVNLDTEITPWLKMNTNLNYGYTENDITGGAYSMALSAPPIFPVYNADGSYAIMGELQSNMAGYQNPVAILDVTNTGKTWNMMGTLGLEVKFLRDFRFRSNVSLNYTNYTQSQYTPSFIDVSGFFGRETSGGGLGSQSQTSSVNTFFENTVTYNKTLRDIHRLDVMVGTSWENYRSSFFSATGRGYPDDYVMNNLSSAVTPAAIAGSDPFNENSMLSFYGRANYFLKDRYLFTFTFRSDASSKFGADNRWGFFPSGAAAWRISEEGFMNNAHWVDELKLRASMGRTGTQSIGDHMWRTLYTPSSYAGANALYPSQLGNIHIGWEATTQADLGLDFTLFGNRLSGTLAWYNKQTSGALLNMTPAPSAAFPTVVYNIADIRNRGVEFDLSADILRGDKFRWNLAFNIAFNRSLVTNIGGNPFSDPNNRDATILGTSVIKEGFPLGLLYSRRVNGIVQSAEQAAAVVAGSSYINMMMPFYGVGDPLYLTDDAGNMIMDVIGYAEPDFFGGFTSTWSYGNWNLLATFTYSYGNDLMYQNSVSDMSMSTLVNRTAMVLDRWTPENRTNKQARNLWAGRNFLSSLNVFDASYLKLKSLTLNYNVPQSFCRKIGVKGASVYASATNLFTLTNYPGPDPEVSDNPGSVIGGGRDISSYPTVKSWTMGIRLNF